MRPPLIDWPFTRWLAAAICCVIGASVIIASVVGDDADALAETLQRDDAAAVAVDEHTVKEIETARLVCAVAWSKLGHNVAISCVPKIPGLFDEPAR